MSPTSSWARTALSFFFFVGRTDMGKSLFCFRNRQSLLSIWAIPITSHTAWVTVSVTNLTCAEPKLQGVALHPMTICMAQGNAVWTGHKAFFCVNSSLPTPVSRLGVVVQTSCCLQLKEMGNFKGFLPNFGINVNGLPLETTLSAHGGCDKSRATSLYVGLKFCVL